MDVLGLIGAIATSLAAAFICVLAGFVAAGLAPNLGDAVERLRERRTAAGPTITIVALFFFAHTFLDMHARSPSAVDAARYGAWLPYALIAYRLAWDLFIGVTYTIVGVCLCASLLEDSSNGVIVDALRVIGRDTPRSLGVAIMVTGLVWFGDHLSGIFSVLTTMVFHLDSSWMTATPSLLFRATAFAIANVTVVSYYLDARLRQGHDIIASLAAPADLSPSE